VVSSSLQDCHALRNSSHPLKLEREAGGSESVPALCSPDAAEALSYSSNSLEQSSRGTVLLSLYGTRVPHPAWRRRSHSPDLAEQVSKCLSCSTEFKRKITQLGCHVFTWTREGLEWRRAAVQVEVGERQDVALRRILLFFAGFMAEFAGGGASTITPSDSKPRLLGGARAAAEVSGCHLRAPQATSPPGSAVTSSSASPTNIPSTIDAEDDVLQKNQSVLLCMHCCCRCRGVTDLDAGGDRRRSARRRRRPATAASIAGLEDVRHASSTARRCPHKTPPSFSRVRRHRAETAATWSSPAWRRGHSEARIPPPESQWFGRPLRRETALMESTYMAGWLRDEAG
jgi:hypothetical protein